MHLTVGQSSVIQSNGLSTPQAQTLPPVQAEQDSGYHSDSVIIKYPAENQGKTIALSGLAGAGVGAITGGSISAFMLPTQSVLRSATLGTLFGAGAGAAAGIGTGYIVGNMVEGKTKAALVGAGVGAVSGGVAGALLGKLVLRGSGLMGAALILIPGAIAGAVSGYTAAHAKASSPTE